MSSPANLQAAISTAKSAKIAKLRTMIEVIDRGGTVRGFVAAGGRVQFAAWTNRASYGGASATCTHSKDAALMAAWRRAALRLIEKIEDAS